MCSENLDCRGGYRKTVINNEHNTILCHLDITIVKYSAIEVSDQLELSLRTVNCILHDSKKNSKWVCLMLSVLRHTDCGL